MAETTTIEWTATINADGTSTPGATFNPWRGCSKVSDGCKFCYADTLSNRNPGTLGVWGKNGTRVVASEAMWKQPVKWNAEAENTGVRKRVFCASLADVFEGRDTMPETSWLAVEMARARLMQLIADTPHLIWQLLTKRPENVVPMLEDLDRGARFLEYLGNVWIGTSVENQAAADERIPQLLNVPAKVRFLSCEPLLGEVRLPLWYCVNGHGNVAPILVNNDKDYGCPHCGCLVSTIGPFNKPGYPMVRPAIHWVIAGGESGPNARPMHPDWARGLRDQCQAAGVPFLFKQWGEWLPCVQRDFTIESESKEDWGLVGPDGFRMVLEKGKRLPDSDPTHFDGESGVLRVGKKRAGRLLDWREHNEFPEVK